MQSRMFEVKNFLLHGDAIVVRKNMSYYVILVSNVERLVFTGISDFSLDALTSLSLGQCSKASI